MNTEKIKTIALLVCLTGFTSCGYQKPDLILGNGSQTLSVAVCTGLSSIYWEQKHLTGPSYDLLRLFAKHSDKTLHVHFVDTATQAFSLLQNKKVDFAAGLLVLPPSGKGTLVSRLNYLTTKNILIHHYLKEPPASLAQIVMRHVETSDNPMHLATLQRIRRENNDPSLWSMDDSIPSHDLFDLVNQGVVDYAVVDSLEWSLLAIDYPRIKKALALTEPLPVGWILHASSKPLIKDLEKFEQFLQQQDIIESLVDRYYGHTSVLSYPERLQLIKGYETIEQNGYLKLFKRVAQKYKLDWKLIAALSYQESLWNARAESPSKVKGLMMITQDIADKFHVTDRYSPTQNLEAGTQYFLLLKKRLPKNITEPDRTWYALVAYNSGYHHLQGIMAKTKAKGLNPYLWVHLKESIKSTPAKSRRQRYNQPVKYVYNIRAYYRLIQFLSGEQPQHIRKRMSWPSSYWGGISL